MDKIKKKGEEIIKKGEEMAKDATSDIKDSVTNLVEKGTKEAQKFFDKKDDVKDDVVDFAKNTKKNVKANLSDLTESKDDKKGTGKIVAGVAVAAAAATAYAVYRRNKTKNEELRQEYAEKLKKWAEIESTERESHEEEFHKPVKVTPKKVYKLGSNALVGDDLIINVSKTGNEFAFNPDDEGKPMAEMDLKKVIMDKTSALKEKITTKFEEGKLQGKLGAMEAKDKYVEIKDMAEDRFEDLKSKVDDEITPNVRKKAEEFKNEAEEKFEELKNKTQIDEKIKDMKDDVKDKKEEAKEKFQDLKDKVSSTAKEKTKEAAEVIEDKGDAVQDKSKEVAKAIEKKGDAVEQKTDRLETKVKDMIDEDKFDKIKRNDMAMDEGSESDSDILEEPFGAEEVMDDDKEEGITDKVKRMATEAKSKIMPAHEEEEKDLMAYSVAIHNRGDEDYSFNPLQFQVYDTLKRSVKFQAKAEEGTTLGDVTIKPDETYQGKLYVRKDPGMKEGIIFFKDLSLEYAVLYLTDHDDPVQEEARLVLDEDYLYSDEDVLKEAVEYKRQ